MKISKPYPYAIKNLFSEIGILRCTTCMVQTLNKKNTCILIYFANSIDQRNLIYKDSLNLPSKSYFYALASQVQPQKINLLFSSGHLKLVILKDSQLFACYSDK